jgi:hypothetical protein
MTAVIQIYTGGYAVVNPGFAVLGCQLDVQRQNGKRPTNLNRCYKGHIAMRYPGMQEIAADVPDNSLARRVGSEISK